MIREAVQRANAEFPGAVFKPGYPTGRGVYMVLDRDRAKALDLLRRAGVEAKTVGCGHDWNYGGDLYRLRPAGWLGAKTAERRRYNKNAGGKPSGLEKPQRRKTRWQEVRSSR
jgi:hypothetical protein